MQPRARGSFLTPTVFDDVPLVVQDRRLDRSGELAYVTSPADIMGMKGDRFLANGREQPYFEAPAQLVRFRLLNGSHARIDNFGLSDDRPFEVIASDAGLLREPVRMTRLLLGPAERAEIVVDLTHERGRSIELRSYSSEIVPILSKQAMEKGSFRRRKLRPAPASRRRADEARLPAAVSARRDPGIASRRPASAARARRRRRRDDARGRCERAQVPRPWGHEPRHWRPAVLLDQS